MLESKDWHSITNWILCTCCHVLQLQILEEKHATRAYTNSVHYSLLKIVAPTAVTVTAFSCHFHGCLDVQ
jgi:hypothetical protein